MRKQRDSRGGSRGGGRAEAEVEVEADAGVESVPEAEGGCHIRPRKTLFLEATVKKIVFSAGISNSR